MVPELFRKLRETPGNKFHLASCKSQSGCPSYDQKTNLVQLFSSNCLNFQFLTSDSDSAGRNPPMLHLQMSVNHNFGKKKQVLSIFKKSVQGINKDPGQIGTKKDPRQIGPTPKFLIKKLLSKK